MIPKQTRYFIKSGFTSSPSIRILITDINHDDGTPHFRQTVWMWNDEERSIKFNETRLVSPADLKKIIEIRENFDKYHSMCLSEIITT